MASANFMAKMRAQSSSPRLRLTFDGTDYDDEIIEIGQITRNANLDAGTVDVTVNNSTGTFNTRITDSTWDQQLAYIKLYFEGGAETYNLFAGIPYRIQYVGKNAVIYLRDRMAKMLTRPVGNWEQPEDYYSVAAPHAGDSYNAAWLIWYILTDSDYGNLDDTEGAGNSDIDWSQFSNFATDCTNSNYAIKGKFTGQTIKDILLRICELTDSYCWVNADGKMSFAMHDGAVSQSAGSENFTDDNTVPSLKTKTPFLDIDMDYIKNHFTVWYGIDPDTDGTGTLTIGQAADSIANYGKYKESDMSKRMWHHNSDSCSSYRGAYIARYKYPRRYAEFEAFMGSWLNDISNTVTVTNSLLSLSAVTMTITEMLLFPKQGKARVKLYWDWD